MEGCRKTSHAMDFSCSCFPTISTNTTHHEMRIQQRRKQEGTFKIYLGYSNAEVVIKQKGWDADLAESVAQASLSALKCLIFSDMDLPTAHPLRAHHVLL